MFFYDQNFLLGFLLFASPDDNGDDDDDDDWIESMHCETQVYAAHKEDWERHCCKRQCGIVYCSYKLFDFATQMKNAKYMRGNSHNHLSQKSIFFNTGCFATFAHVIHCALWAQIRSSSPFSSGPKSVTNWQRSPQQLFRCLDGLINTFNTYSLILICLKKIGRPQGSLQIVSW